MMNTTHPEELIELVELENQVQTHRINSSTSLDVMLDHRNITIKNGNLCFSSSMNNQIKYQLGIRLWHTDSFAEIRKKWNKEDEYLREAILHMLKRRNIRILFIPQEGQNII